MTNVQCAAVWHVCASALLCHRLVVSPALAHPTGKPIIGFCFSFPVDQTALDNGRVLSMTKARWARELVAMHEACRRTPVAALLACCFAAPLVKVTLHPTASRIMHTIRPATLPCATLQNFKGTGLLGRDVVAELRRELAAQGIDALVPAVMNDTVATLVSWLQLAGCRWAD